MRLVKAFLKWLGIAVLAVVALFLLALGYINTAPGKRQISELATSKLHRQVVLTGGVAIPLSWPPALRVRGLTVANMEGGKAPHMLDLGTFEIAVAPLALLEGRIELPYVKLYDSTVHLERSAQKKANWSFGADEPQEKKEDKPFELPLIGALDLKNSHILYLDQPQKIDIDITGGSTPDSVSIAGGGVYLSQKFSVKATGGSLLGAMKHEPYPIDTTVSVGHTSLHAKGTIDDPMHFAGLNIALTVKGASASDLFPLIGVVLPPTPPYDVTGQLSYDKDANVWKFERFKGRLGSSDLGGSLAFAMTKPRAKLTANFVSDKLDFKDLGPLVGTPPEKEKAVSADQKQKVAKAEASPYVIPDTPIDVSRLGAMDADVTFTGKHILSPSLPLDDFFLKVNLEDRLLKIQPLRFGTADGDIKADLTINGRVTPFTTTADLEFRKLSLARLFESVGRKLGEKHVADGFIGGRAELSGKGRSLHQILGSANGAVGLGMAGGDISNLIIEAIGLDLGQSLGFLFGGDRSTGVRCVVADFGVQGGLMKSNAVVIDTHDTEIKGAGTLNWADERMDFRLKAEPKDMSWMSFRTPIDIKGTLKHPSVSLEKANLLAKGGGAVAIGVLLTPIASILALVDPSHGKDADCSGLLQSMKSHTAADGKGSNVPVNPTRDDTPMK